MEGAKTHQRPTLPFKIAHPAFSIDYHFHFLLLFWSNVILVEVVNHFVIALDNLLSVFSYRLNLLLKLSLEVSLDFSDVIVTVVGRYGSAEDTKKCSDYCANYAPLPCVRSTLIMENVNARLEMCEHVPLSCIKNFKLFLEEVFFLDRLKF